MSTDSSKPTVPNQTAGGDKPSPQGSASERSPFASPLSMAKVRTSAALKQNGSSEPSPTAGTAGVVLDGVVLAKRCGGRHLFEPDPCTAGQARPACHRGGTEPAGRCNRANTTRPTVSVDVRIHAAGTEPLSAAGAGPVRPVSAGGDTRRQPVAFTLHCGGLGVGVEPRSCRSGRCLPEPARERCGAR